jgi:hypothetical protein
MKLTRNTFLNVNHKIYIYIYISNQLEQDFLSPEETTAAVHDPSQSEKGLAHLKKKKNKKK